MSMQERPISFNAEMIRALRKGRKTQTRRVIKPQPDGLVRGIAELQPLEGSNEWAEYHFNGDGTVGFIECPYGKPGDRLWVREESHYCLGSDNYQYAADGYDLKKRVGTMYPELLEWTPASEMQRKASRITLRVESVRVQPLQNMSDIDAMKEGCELPTDSPRNFRRTFRALWDSIYASQGYGWDANPWVWSITFRVLP